MTARVVGLPLTKELCDSVTSAAKHIYLLYHFIQDEISKGLVSLKWCAGNDQLADIITNALSRPAYELLRYYIHVVNRESQVE